MENGLVVVKQLPIIEERLREFKHEVDEKVTEAKSLVCTENTRAQVKSYRAELNKQYKELETARKKVKEQIMQPYMEFEATYNECVSIPMKSADADLKQKIDEVEGSIKQDKCEQLEAYLTECCVGYGVPEDMVSLDRLGIKVNLSTTVSSAKKRIVELLQRIAGEIQYIGGMEYADEVMVEYRKSLNPVSAAQIVSDRHKRMEEERQRRQKQAQEQAAKETAAEKVELAVQDQPEQAEMFQAPTIERLPEDEKGATSEYADDSAQKEKKYAASFTVYGTMEQLKALAAFLREGEYEYETK